MRNLAVLLFVFLSMTLMIPVFSAEEPDWANAIDMAGRQRMLTQRITKSFLQAGLAANAEIAREQLTRSTALFEKQHAELMRLALPGEIRNTLEHVRADWLEFKVLANGELTRSSVERLVALDEKLLQGCEHVVYLLEEMSGTRQGRLVNMSGRQRMLSQRLAKNYMLLSAGFDSPAVLEQLGDDKVEFRKTLNTLVSERNYSPQVSEKLAKVEEHWIWLESSLGSMSENYYPIIVADTSEKILYLLESLTRLYATVEGEQATRR